MRRLNALAGAGAALLALAQAGAVERGAGIPELLRSARLWEALEHPEVERPVLEKILAVDRTEPTALLLLAQIELERGDLVAARATLARLEAAHAGSIQARELKDLVRVYTQDSARLARLRVLERGGRMQDALALARVLFPDGPPPAALADEFASLLGRDSARWAALRALLEERLAREDNPVDREALAELLSLHEPTQARSMRIFEDLALHRRGASDRLAGAWKRAIGRMPEGEDTQAERERYLARFGRDRSIESDLRRAAQRRAVRDGGSLAAIAPEAATPPAQALASARIAPPAPDPGSAPESTGADAGATAPSPPDPAAIREQARQLHELGRDEDARTLLEQALAARPDDPWIRFDLAKGLLAAGLGERALELAREGLARAPGDADMRFAAALLFAAADRNEEALAAVEPIATADRSAGVLGLEQRVRDREAEVSARARPWLEAGLLYSRRSASEGLSSLRGTEAPLRLSWPLTRGGIAFAQADLVRIDGGTPSAADAPQLGSLAVNPSGAGFAPSSHGTSFAAGWRGEDRRFDLGAVGMGGFAVGNWVGGWREAFPLGATQASLQASRRVLTGSRLSYAGEVDPGTGFSWGGVTDNALAGRLARDFAQAWSASTLLSLSALRGRHVQENTSLQSRTTLERTIAQGPGVAVRAGVVASLWHFARNENFTTLGMGGYYSPQRYAALGLSLAFDYDRAPWSATIRATPSRSWTREDAAPWFPLDGALQARSGNAMHAASNGGGLAGSLHAAFQVRLARDWSAGGAIDIDRSAYYAPTTAMLFLRWAFTGPISPALPVAPAPISRY